MKKGVGILLIIIAVVAAVASQPIHQQGLETYLFEDSDKGRIIMTAADLVKYVGIGIGAIGLALLIAGLIKKSDSPAFTPKGGAASTSNKLFCMNCGNALAAEDKFCPNCGESVTKGVT